MSLPVGGLDVVERQRGAGWGRWALRCVGSELARCCVERTDFGGEKDGVPPSLLRAGTGGEWEAIGVEGESLSFECAEGAGSELVLVLGGGVVVRLRVWGGSVRMAWVVGFESVVRVLTVWRV